MKTEEKIYYIAEDFTKEELETLKDFGYDEDEVRPTEDPIMAFKSIARLYLYADKQPERAFNALFMALIEVINEETRHDSSEMEIKEMHELDGFSILDAIMLLVEAKKVDDENNHEEILELMDQLE